MNVDAVAVEGYHEMLALHRFLFECKMDDLTSVYAGSPFIAAIQNRLADALEPRIREPDGPTGGPQSSMLIGSRQCGVTCRPPAVGGGT